MKQFVPMADFLSPPRRLEQWHSQNCLQPTMTASSFVAVSAVAAAAVQAMRAFQRRPLAARPSPPIWRRCALAVLARRPRSAVPAAGTAAAASQCRQTSQSRLRTRLAMAMREIGTTVAAVAVQCRQTTLLWSRSETKKFPVTRPMQKDGLAALPTATLAHPAVVGMLRLGMRLVRRVHVPIVTSVIARQRWWTTPARFLREVLTLSTWSPHSRCFRSAVAAAAAAASNLQLIPQPLHLTHHPN